MEFKDHVSLLTVSTDLSFQTLDGMCKTCYSLLKKK